MKIRMFMSPEDGGGNGGGNAGGNDAPQESISPGGGSTPRSAGLSSGDIAAMNRDKPGGNTGDQLPEGFLKMEKRPDWAPEKFWDTKSNSLKVTELAKAYGEVEKRQFMRTDDLKKSIEREFHEQRTANRPAKADDYKLELPKDFKLPEGTKLEFRQDSPLTKFWRDFAYENGLNQEQFSTGLAAYMAEIESSLPDPKTEKAKLGDSADQRIADVQNWIKATVGDKHVQALGPFVTSAAAVEALEALMTKTGAKPMGGDNNTAPESYSRDQLRQMMKDPRYHDPFKRDPEFVKKVQEGYARLGN